MKYLFLFILTIANFISYSQLSYDDINDLKSLCKKEDYQAVKKFLANEGYSLEIFNTNYDHGSYYVLLETKAQKQLGSMSLPHFSGFEIDDKIEISFTEYDTYKSLNISQKIFTDYPLHLSFVPFDALYKWLNESWTSVTIRNQSDNKYDYIGQQYGDFNFVDTSLKQVSKADLNQYASSKNFSSETSYYYLSFMNSNPLIGDLKYNILSYSKTSVGIYNYSLFLETKYLKGENVDQDTAKLLSFPLMRNGNTYFLTIKFGDLIKTFVFDTGASDMSIDDDIYQYLKNSNQLKNESRLTDATYQLADGSTVRFKRIRIPSFSINNVIVKDIQATIVKNGMPLLLGKSFLDSFKSWKIDNENQTLVVELF